MPDTRRCIEPHEYVTAEEIQHRLNVSKEYVADLKRLFGLYPIAGGGGTPMLFLGEVIHEAQKRFGRNEPVGRRFKPPSREELRRLRCEPVD